MDTHPNSDVLVVVPMYNEASILAGVLAGLRDEFPRVLCVDDGSVDGSAAVAAAGGATVLSHLENFGQGAALQTAFEYARRDPSVTWVVTFDADGQHRVADAVAMLGVAREETWDVVFGSRFLGAESTTMPRSRRTMLRASVGFTRWSTGLRLTDSHVGLRVLGRHAFTTIDLTLGGMAHASELHHQVRSRNLTFREIPVTVDYTDYSRAKGQANINAINIAFDMLTMRLRSER